MLVTSHWTDHRMDEEWPKERHSNRVCEGAIMFGLPTYRPQVVSFFFFLSQIVS